MKHSPLIALLGAGSIAALTCAAPAQGRVGSQIQLSLPAQDLSISLREVSTRTGGNIIAPDELVRGRQAPAVSGAFTLEGAVRLLLTGSGLEVRRVGEALVIFAPAAASVGAETRSDAAIAAEEIVVTGTNIRGAEPTSPVIVLRRRDIDRSGATSVEQLMATLPQNAQGGVNNENFQVPGAGADPTEHGAGVNLRGLGQRATLVLINGRRMAPSNTGAFVDISLIPLTAIERVEILTDGASAVYGSDAVGGVVNFILRDDFKGLETSAQAGTATRGDGDVLQLGVTGGTSWGSGRGLVSYEYRLEDEIVAADRPFVLGLRPTVSLFPRERRHSLFGNIVQDFGPRLQVEASGSYGTRETERSFFLTGSPVPAALAAKGKAYNLSGTARYALGSDWSVQLSGGHAVNDSNERQARPGEQGLINERFTRNMISDAGLKLDGALVRVPAGPLRVALGAEYRSERYRESFRTRTIKLDYDQSRDVRAAYFEAQLPLFSSLNRRPGFERLTVTAAGRYEHYDRFGSTFNPRLGILWSPVPALALRSAYDTSFRAPLLSETAGAYSAIYLPPIFFFLNPAEARGVGLALGGSNPDVQPERSRSWTAGLEFTPSSVPGLSLGLNHYSIRFSDRIALPAPSITVVGNPAYDSIVTRDPDDDLVRRLIGGAQVATDLSGPGFTNGHATPADVSVIVDGRYNNTAETRTKGFDFNVSYGFSAGKNQLLLAANANYILSYTDQLRPTSIPVKTLDTPYGPLDFRARAQAGWSRGPWSANLFLNHADGYRDRRGGRDLPVGSFTTVDFGLAYDAGQNGGPGWLRRTRIALHIENLLDTAPPRLLPDPGSTVGIGYDPVNASGRGRFVSMQLRRTW